MSSPDSPATTAHLIETAGHHLGHSARHLEQLKKSRTKKQRDFNQEHLDTHLKGGIEHVKKLMDHVKSNYPAEAKELANIENAVPHTVMGRIKQAVKRSK